MKSKVLYFFATVAVAVMLSSCGQVPQKEIDAANAVIENAKLAGADVYIPQVLAGMQDSLNKAMELIEGAKSSWMPDYKPALEKINAIVNGGADIQTQIETRKTELKTEATNLVGEIKTLVEENKTLIPQAPKGKEAAQALEAITADNTALDATIAEITTMLEGGELIATVDKAKAAKEKAISINTELKSAIEKAGNKGK